MGQKNSITNSNSLTDFKREVLQVKAKFKTNYTTETKKEGNIENLKNYIAEVENEQNNQNTESLLTRSKEEDRRKNVAGEFDDEVRGKAEKNATSYEANESGEERPIEITDEVESSEAGLKNECSNIHPNVNIVEISKITALTMIRNFEELTKVTDQINRFKLLVTNEPKANEKINVELNIEEDEKQPVKKEQKQEKVRQAEVKKNYSEEDICEYNNEELPKACSSDNKDEVKGDFCTQTNEKLKSECEDSIGLEVVVPVFINNKETVEFSPAEPGVEVAPVIEKASPNVERINPIIEKKDVEETCPKIQEAPITYLKDEVKQENKGEPPKFESETLICPLASCTEQFPTKDEKAELEDALKTKQELLKDLRMKMSMIECERDEANFKLRMAEKKCRAYERESRSLEVALGSMELKLRTIVLELCEEVEKSKLLEKQLSNAFQNVTNPAIPAANMDANS